MQQIRLTRTPEIDKVFSFLKSRYPLLSEAELIKMSLSRAYKEEVKKEMTMKERREELAKAFRKLSEKLRPYGEEFLKKKGKKLEDLTMEEEYDLVAEA